VRGADHDVAGYDIYDDHDVTGYDIYNDHKLHDNHHNSDWR
jgi:hypothetical protein